MLKLFLFLNLQSALSKICSHKNPQFHKPKAEPKPESKLNLNLGLS